MWLLLFSVVVGTVMIAARAKELKDIKDSLKDILKDNKFELDDLDSNQAIDFLTKNKVKIADFEYHQSFDSLPPLRK